MKKNILLITFFFVVYSISTIVYSQTPRSTKGKEFWVGWPGNSSTNQPPYCGIYILGKKLTRVKLIHGDTTHYVLSDTNNYLLNIGLPLPTHVDVSEQIENKALVVLAEDSVEVYMSSVSSFETVETSVVYPFLALTAEYFVLTKKEGSAKTQFLVVAPRDSTFIEITPSVTTENGKLANIPFLIMLQKGQTYLVRSSGDLTGSRVRTIDSIQCNPIAVFTSSPNTTIGNCAPSAYLLEQLPPTVLLGSNYIVPSFPRTPGSILRAMAITPETQIRLNGVNQGTPISTGQFREMFVDSVAYINSNKPFMLAQFTRGGECDTPKASVPTMTILNGLNQRQREAKVTPPPFSNLFEPTDTFTLSIITRSDERGVTRINNQPIPFNDWHILPSNPFFSIYNTNIFERKQYVIKHDMSGFIATMHGSVTNYGFAMSAGGDFSQTIFGRFDTAGVFGRSTYCLGETAHFSADTDPFAHSFQWIFGDGSLDTGKVVSHIYENSGNYSVRLIFYRDAFCSYDTVRKTISIRIPPTIKAGSRPTLTLCKNQTALLGTNQLPGVTYRWSPAIGLSDTTVGQPMVTALFDSVKYYVRGYDQFGCETRDSIVVKLYDQPIANAGPDTVSCGGNGVQIGRQTTGGTPQYSFLWTPATGLSNDKIERPISAPSTNTTYILRVTDANGCMGYDTVNIQALPSPTIDAGNPATICEGDSVQLSATGAPTYRWVNARNINDTTIGNPTVYPTVTTTYYVAGLFETGCVAFDSVLVTVTPKPRLPIAFQTTACPNATKTYTVENRNDLTYSWEINGGNLSTGQGTNEATVVWGAGPTGSIKLTTTTAGSCKFDTVVAVTISSDIKPTITENKKNTVLPSRGTVRICPNESVTLDVGVGYTEISWTNGSTSRQTTVNTEGWYGVSVKDATGCSGGDSVYVEVALPPVIFAGNDRVLCGADTAVMRPNVTGSGTYTYQWIPPTAVSDPTALVTNFIAPNTTNLIFQAIDTTNGCITSDTVLMTILTLAGDFITTSKPNNVLCFGEQMTLDAGAFDSYLWSTGETTRTITITSGGSYWVDAKSGSCSAIDTIQIVQNTQIVVIPTPDITASPGATVTLDANATGGTLPYQFQWTPNVNFVDPTTVQSPRVTTNVGSQSYIVTITDANGCTARDTITVFVPSTATTVAIARREVSATAFGERFPITLTLDPNTPITPSGFTATITVPFEQFIPKSVSNGTMTVTQNATDYVININVQIDEPLYNNSVITELIGDILLGQQDSTTIVISYAQWTGTTYPVNAVNGAIVLNDVCYSGTRRYLLPTTVGFGILSVHPNPANTKATFEFGIIEAGQTTFEIIDVFGNVVHAAEFNREPATPKGDTDDNRYTHTVDISNLPSGTYYGVLKSFSQRESVPLVITR